MMRFIIGAERPSDRPACQDPTMAHQKTARVQTVRVYLEQADRRSFAVAVDWPGWARSGPTAEAALDALAGHLPRYLAVVRAAGQEPPPTGPDGPEFTVVERVPGNATTTFGAPGVVPALDTELWSPDAADRQALLVAACWRRLGQVVAEAPPQLRKGPRGGGRDRQAIVEHVLNAELAYARKIGVKVPPPADPEQVQSFRRQLLAALRDSARRVEAAATAPGPPARRGAGWPPSYAARRIGWHVLDHAWEIEDRSDPPG